MAAPALFKRITGLIGAAEADADARGHLLIAGTGRAGTTLMVRICTRLGLDTGFDEADIAEAEANIGNAGLETRISARKAARMPDVIKSPHVVDVLAEGIDKGWLRIDHAIIPVRELTAAAESRRSVAERAAKAGMDPRKAPGGLWKTDDPAQQEAALAMQFYKVVEGLVARDVPLSLVSFPRFATDADYFLRVLGPLFAARYGLTEAALRAAHASECRRELIRVGPG